MLYIDSEARSPRTVRCSVSVSFRCRCAERGVSGSLRLRRRHPQLYRDADSIAALARSVMVCMSDLQELIAQYGCAHIHLVCLCICVPAYLSVCLCIDPCAAVLPILRPPLCLAQSVHCARLSGRRRIRVLCIVRLPLLFHCFVRASGICLMHYAEPLRTGSRCWPSLPPS